MRAFGVVHERTVVQFSRSGGYEGEFEGLERWKTGRVVVKVGESINNDIVMTVDMKRTKRGKCVENI
jgi:hypothetical protein